MTLQFLNYISSPKDTIKPCLLNLFIFNYRKNSKYKVFYLIDFKLVQNLKRANKELKIVIFVFLQNETSFIGQNVSSIIPHESIIIREWPIYVMVCDKSQWEYQ